jgi:hypothetical protein
MAVNMGRTAGSTLREQFLTLKVMANNIRSQEQFLMMIDREQIILTWPAVSQKKPSHQIYLE